MSANALVLILLGSDSDLPEMESCFFTLQKLGIAHEVVIASAHRTPDRVKELASNARARGIRVLIAAAGGAAHLAGAVASQTTLPVIGVPLATSPLHGVDALYATVNMPPGVPVATVSVGKWGAQNAAILAAQVLSLGSPEIEQRLQDRKREAAATIEEKNRRLADARAASGTAG